MKSINSIILLLAGIILVQCATVAVTGRRQLALVPNSEIMPLSYTEYDKVKASNKVVTGTPEAEMVKRSGVRIQKAVEKYMAEKGFANQLEGFEWEFILIDDPTVNAWCMPGGKVAFYTGILPICKDENGLAVVMGHEVAHAIAHHGRERMSQGMLAQFGMASVQLAMGQNPTMTQQLLLQSVGVGTQLGILKFSRTHESEADKMGLNFMAIAGYNPSEAPKFWERMAGLSSGAAPPEFLSTHPSHSTRISDLNKWMPEAMQYYNNSKN